MLFAIPALALAILAVVGLVLVMRLQLDFAKDLIEIKRRLDEVERGGS